MYASVLSGLVLLFVCTVGSEDVKCASDFASFVSKDCTEMWQCVWGNPVKMPDCKAKGLIYSRQYKVCVWKNSAYDDCKLDPSLFVRDGPCESKPCKNGGTCTRLVDGKHFFCTCPPTHTGPTCGTVVTQFNVATLCAYNPTLLIPHPTECQLYYNCSHAYQTVPRYFEQHLQECPYPLLFSAKTKTCEAFEDVQCGYRTEHKSGCEYRQNICRVAHCIPCNIKFPSCELLGDGMYPHSAKVGTPWYMVCRKGRTIKTGICPMDPFSRKQLFVTDGSCRGL